MNNCVINKFSIITIFFISFSSAMEMEKKATAEDTVLIKRNIKHKREYGAKDSHTYTYGNNQISLIEAIKEHHKDPNLSLRIKIMIEAKANINEKFTSTPLAIAIKELSAGEDISQNKQIFETIKIILENKADPNIGDCIWGSPLHLAVKRPNLTSHRYEVINLLLEKEANPNQESNSCTPVYAIIHAIDLSVLSLLLDNKANPFTIKKNTLNDFDLKYTAFDIIKKRALDSDDLDTLNRCKKMFECVAKSVKKEDLNNYLKMYISEYKYCPNNKEAENFLENTYEVSYEVSKDNIIKLFWKNDFDTTIAKVPSLIQERQKEEEEEKKDKLFFADFNLVDSFDKLKKFIEKPLYYISEIDMKYDRRQENIQIAKLSYIADLNAIIVNGFINNHKEISSSFMYHEKEIEGTPYFYQTKFYTMWIKILNEDDIKSKIDSKKEKGYGWTTITKSLSEN